MDRLFECSHCASPEFEVIVVTQATSNARPSLKKRSARGPVQGDEQAGRFAWNQANGTTNSREKRRKWIRSSQLRKRYAMAW